MFACLEFGGSARLISACSPAICIDLLMLTCLNGLPVRYHHVHLRSLSFSSCSPAWSSAWSLSSCSPAIFTDQIVLTCLDGPPVRYHLVHLHSLSISSCLPAWRIRLFAILHVHHLGGASPALRLGVHHQPPTESVHHQPVSNPYQPVRSTCGAQVGRPTHLGQHHQLPLDPVCVGQGRQH